MKLQMTVIAAALALGFAGAAQAQSTTPRDTDKPRTEKKADRADRKVKNADEERIESEYKAAKEKCDAMDGNAKDICQAEAKAKEKVAKAENDAKHSKDPKAQAKVQRVKADAEYDVAKERCDEKKGNEKDVCMKEARVQRDKARAGSARTERSATTGSTAPEKRTEK